MNPEKRAALTCALQNMSDYLTLSGWVNIDWATDETIFLWKDPMMGTPHRTDIAFMIQSDRDVYELIKSKP